MPLETGSRLGEYEIVGVVGAGGMGEVYRARDHRLGRDVALKILPESLLDNQDRLVRFRREAQSAGALNHPNLLTVHELGLDGGRHYIVSELLEGVTLRERLAGGPLAGRRAIEIGSQIAEGLAAAHERGIVHRDLKPENVFVTRDGRVKILDFGLAKPITPVVERSGDSATVKKSLTDEGTVLGTVGYMSPEQVRGDAVDARSDIFALGAILYEMVSGRRAFHGTSSVDTMHAILHQDPPELSQTNPQILPALQRIVDHCLEKDPERRFQSARDLAFNLASLSGSSVETVAPKMRGRIPAAPLWIAAIAIVAAATWFVARATLHRPVPRFRRLTFQSRGLATAAFTNDGQSIVYSTPELGGGRDVRIAPIGSSAMRSIGISGADVLSVSKRGELALLLRARYVGAFITVGTLARVPLAGGAPREVTDDVQWADWTPSGEDLLVLRSVGGKTRLELPIGNVIYETTGWISTPRLSPDGKTVAFGDHPVSADDGGVIAVVGPDRQKRALTPFCASAQGLAWRPDGKEIWYTAAEEGNSAVLYGVSLSGKSRLLATAPGILWIHDIAADGRALLSRSDIRIRLNVRGPSDGHDRDLSWLDWSLLRDMTQDGRYVLFDETGEGAGKTASMYIRDVSGAPAVRLGDGSGGSFSPDGKAILTVRKDGGQIFMYPTGAGQVRQITSDGLTHAQPVWLHDGHAIVYAAHDLTHPARLYVQDLAGGAARPITPPGVSGTVLAAPDGRRVLTRGPDGVITIYALNGEAEVKVPELTPEHACARFSSDGRSLLYFRRNENPTRVFALDLATRRSRLIREIPVPESLFGVNNLRLSSDEKTYAYSFVTSTSDLYLLTDVR